jgi:tetratricopeptide (TPR) repeat protein
MRTRPTGNLSAYDLFLQARECFGSDETASRAEPFLRKAIELDPDFSDAHALLSMMHTIGYMHDIQTYHLHDALASAQRALELDPSGPLANHANGYALMFLHRLDEAGFYLRNAIELNPNEIYFRGEYANWMNYAGDSEGALREIKEALRRDPYANDWFWNVRGNIDTAAGRYTDALASMHRMKSPTPWSYCYRAICHVELGQLAQAQECLERFRLVVTHMTAADFIASRPYAATVSRRMVEALRQVETAINGRNKN